MRIGILALQGGFAEHTAALNALGISSVEIRKKTDMETDLNGLIIPGGESTVIGKLLHETGLFGLIKDRIDGGMAVWGTCAGMILLADKIADESYSYLDSIHITVRRNAFGRQLGSFHTTGSFEGIGEIPMTFIRAPYIETIGGDVKPLASVNGKIVAAENENVLVTAFHPELTDDRHVLEYFLSKIKKGCA